MWRFWFLCAAVIATPLHAQCRLCPPISGAAPAAALLPLRVEIDASLDLGRAAQTRPQGAGTIEMDAISGARRVTGTLADLGGMALKGVVRLTGTPFAPVAISLPARVRLVSPDGSTADVVNLRTDVGANATLDAAGRLNVAFGGRLVVTGGVAGDFRGRIPVTADYR